ncbi:MAG TPA: hypothetical protein GX511_01195 [Firmicutes bacterium]|nr:hypothetical protein [Bacillota bacterium]
MTKKEYLLVQAKIAAELNNIAALEEELAAHGLLATTPPDKSPAFPSGDSFQLRALGSVLHDFYVAVENIFETIAREIDESLPSDPAWHVALLKQMTLVVPELRPAVIGKTTAAKLDQYRAFRHVFRNVYGFNLDSDRLRRLLTDLPSTLTALRNDLKAFQEQIRALPTD